MKKILFGSAALMLVMQVGCIVAEPRERVVYREYREVPPPQPVPQEEYRPLPPPPPPVETVEVVEGPEVQVVEFHERLAPYGRWVQVEGYGDCFLPADCPPGWRPYTLGHWVYTDSGMCWVSEEHFGWACYHYGRWIPIEGLGWAWVPASRWGPAWVAWRNGGGYCGWAPLRPRRERVEVIEVSDGDVEAIPSTEYIFCEERYVNQPRVYERCVPPERNVTIINKTVNITRITVVNNRVVNQSWDQTRIQHATGRPPERVQVRQTRDIDELKVEHKVVEVRHDEHPAAPIKHPGASDDRAGGPQDHPADHPARVAEHPAQHDAPAHHESPAHDAPGPHDAAAQHDAPPAPGPDEKAAYEADVAQINQQYQQQKAQMNQRFAEERRKRPPGQSAQDLARQEAKEAQDLEQQHQQQLAAAKRQHHQK
jgi:hypothetical protein